MGEVLIVKSFSFIDLHHNFSLYLCHKLYFSPFLTILIMKWENHRKILQFRFSRTQSSFVCVMLTGRPVKFCKWFSIHLIIPSCVDNEKPFSQLWWGCLTAGFMALTQPPSNTSLHLVYLLEPNKSHTTSTVRRWVAQVAQDFSFFSPPTHYHCVISYNLLCEQCSRNETWVKLIFIETRRQMHNIVSFAMLNSVDVTRYT